MRNSLWIAMMAAAAALAVTAEPGAARVSYPWCARLADWSGASSCAFTTYAQCMAEVSGIGGFCSENPFLPKPASPQPKKPKAYMKSKRD